MMDRFVVHVPKVDNIPLFVHNTHSEIKIQNVPHFSLFLLYNYLGFKGDGRFCERDQCSEDPCYPGVNCYDTESPPFFRCGPCPEGYRGDGINCIPSACEQRPPPCFQVYLFWITHPTR